MKVLVTGASGFLGKHVIQELTRLQYTIDTIGRSNTATIVADISKEVPSLSKQYDLVVHAAGKAHVVPKTEAEKQEFYDVNLTGTKNLIEALKKTPSYFIFISSVAVYGLVSGDKIIETEELKAVDSYGASKVCAEKIILDWCKKNHVCCTILRLPLLVSENPPGNLG
jgi:nucleoside-diphosphate-sugar epimerase